MISSISSSILLSQHLDFFRPSPNGDGSTECRSEQGFMDYTDDSCMDFAARMISASVIQHGRFESLGTESQFNPKEISIDRRVLYNGHAGLGANASARACDSGKNEVSVESLKV